MKNTLFISNKIKKFNKNIFVQGDKSLSIRWALMASQAIGKSRAYNLLNSEDVKSTLNAIRKLGIKVQKKKNYCEINGQGLNGFSSKNNVTINAGNSGTLSRLLPGVLVKSKNSIKIVGDKSLSKRDFSRIIKPLSAFGVKILSKKNKLPLKIKGTDFLRPIEYDELKGSAQVKSCIMLAALNTPGITKIRALRSRDHTERLFKFLKIPININKQKNIDIIEINGQFHYKSFNFRIPGDISSCSAFLVLTLLSKNSEILIKNINVNKTRTGIIDILKKMNAKIKLKNKRLYNGEEIADINVKSTKYLKAVRNSPSNNSRYIDELPLIFYACACAKGVSYFKNLGELRQKECDRLKFSARLLKMIGIKVIETKDSLKIFGNPNLELNDNYVIKNFDKDHRACILSCIVALTLGGRWKIHDANSINTSFPNFLSILKSLGAKIN